MNSTFLNIEKTRTSLIEFLEYSNSKRASLIYINNFFSLLLKSNNNLLISSYLTEFADTYFELLIAYDVNCIDPDLTKRIITQAREVLSLTDEEDKRKKYNEILSSAENKLVQLTTYLSGNSFDESQQKFLFPLLEENYLENNNIRLGLIESVSIQIKKTDERNNFNIIPSERELEHKIKQQIETSWVLAILYVKKYVKKMSKYHDVVISFDNKWGIVTGNSLGTALTLAFIKELLTHYNAPILLNSKDGSAFTGGISDSGAIISLSGEVIKNKTSAVFYSGIKTFAVPKEDEETAQEMLNELKLKYPDRKLKISGVEDFEDLINRRNLVDIKKINPVIRGGKFLARHSLSIILIAALSLMIILTGILDFNVNPTLVTYENSRIKVYNKNKKLLWSTSEVNLSEYFLDNLLIKRQYAILSDVNKDGKNEIIMSNVLFGINIFNREYNNIVCYDYARNLVWKHTFAEIVSTNKITFSSEYRTKFIDIYELNNRRILFVIAQNYYFPSAVFGIDIASGELATDIFWHSGHLDEGLIAEDSVSQKDKLIIAGINNGFESTCLIVLDIMDIAGQAPAPSNYKFINIPEANLLEYVLIQPSDYSIAKNNRFNVPARSHLVFEDNMIRIGVNEDASLGEVGAMLYYYFNPDFTKSFIETSDYFQHNRDKLVKEGKLSLPLTYTPEYFEILKNNIRYWDGEKFVSPSEYFKNRHY